MAKKGKKFETEAAQDLGQAQATNPVQKPPQVEGEPQENGEGEKAAVQRGFHLVCETADVNGRTDYRFAKYSVMPKRAPRMHVIVDGEETEMAVTNSGGYAMVKGYNGYLAARGFTGWILFGNGVDPQSAEQFPDGLVFTSKDGSCDANPLREPANPEGEKKRREAAAAAAKKRAAEKGTAAPEGEGAEDKETEDADAE